MNDYPNAEFIFGNILDERKRQEDLVRAGRFPFSPASLGLLNTERLPILLSQAGEVARQVLQQPDSGLVHVTHAGNFDHFRAEIGKAPREHEPADGTIAGLRMELVQLAAVAVAWIEALDSLHGSTAHSPRTIAATGADASPSPTDSAA